jgi:hypothetical protein
MQTPKRKTLPKRPAKKLTETPTRRDVAVEFPLGAPWISQRSRDQRSAFADFIDQKF